MLDCVPALANHWFTEEQLCMLTIYNSSTVLHHRQEYIVKDKDAELWGKSDLSSCLIYPPNS